MLLRGVLLPFAVLLAMAFGACGHGPNAPDASMSPSSGQRQTCRVYAAALTLANTSGTFSSTVTLAGAYSTSTNQLTYAGSYSDSLGCAIPWDLVTNYSSVADFVDETRVVPPLTRSTGSTATTTDARCDRITVTASHSYDSQGRLIRIVTVSSPGGTETRNYTTWDSVGRPTGGTISSAGNTRTHSLSYDDAARTVTITGGINTGGIGPQSVETETYDSSGILLRKVTTVLGSTVITSTVTTTSTNRVCR